MRRLTQNNSLVRRFPELCKEWHPAKNYQLKPEAISFGSRKKVWWICQRGHEWLAEVSARTGLKTGCPRCVSATSDFELRVFSEIRFFYKDAENRKKINSHEVDIFIPSLDLAIEFDGFYWHKEKIQKDEIKAKNLRKSGISLIRMREAGLPIREHDIEVPIRYKTKKDLNRLFFAIFKRDQNRNTRRALKKYVKRKKYINDKYYNSLLFCLPGPLPGNSFFDLYPKIACEWHKEKNGTLTPSKVSKSSGKVVWWICSRGHEWRARVAHRANGVGCPFCAGNVLTDSNRFSINRPDLLKEWDFNKNRIKPSDITVKNSKKVWWLCSKGHSWRSPVYSRSSGYGCPYCSGRNATSENNLLIKYPEIEKFWDHAKNKRITLQNTTPQSHRRIWWKCSVGHSWQQLLRSFLLSKIRCPVCSGKLVTRSNCLASSHPDLAKEWNHLRNNSLTPFSFTTKSTRRVWWKCKKGHEWKASIKKRVFGQQCLVCTGKKVSSENNLAKKFPSVAAWWHPNKNNLTPHEILPYSNKKVWWICPQKHEWEAVITSRVRGNGCPFCSGKKVFKGNSLYACNPELASQWSSKNEIKSDQVRPNSHLKVWWICIKGHEWKASIASRNRGRKCPICSNKIVSSANSLTSTNPDLASEWNLARNSPLTPMDVVAGSHKKVWWVCSQGHNWNASVKSRSKGCGCPICYRNTFQRTET